MSDAGTLPHRLNPSALVWSEIWMSGDCIPDEPESLLLPEKLDPLDLLALLLPEPLPLELTELASEPLRECA